MTPGVNPPEASDQSNRRSSTERNGKDAEKWTDASTPGDSGQDAAINSPRSSESQTGGVVQSGAVHGEDELDRQSSEEIFSPKPHPLDHRQGKRTRKKWLLKVKSLFCCFSPPGRDKSYQPTPEPDADLRETELMDRESVGRPTTPVPPAVYSSFVIGPKCEEDKSKKTLVLDLDETLVHSSFKPVEDPDFVIPVDIDGRMVDVYVMKRPWLEHFLRTVGSRFEVVVFTASLSKYADPLLDLLDEASVVRWRLFREACSPYEGNFVKDLGRLGRDLAQTIIVDNSPLSYIFHPSNALPIGAFLGEKDDQELLEMVPLLMDLEGVDDVREYLAQKSDGFTRHVLSNGVSLVPLGSGVGSEVVRN